MRTVARRYRGLGLSDDDLFQEGALGLLDAVEHFDAERGRFEPYARFCIRRAIRNALTDTSRLIRLPKHVVERRRAIDRIAAQLTAAAGREPTTHEIAAALELSDGDVRALGSVFGAPLSIDELAVVDLSSPPPDDEVVRVDQELRVDALVGDLPPRQREIVERHFGLDCRAEPISAVAQSLHISEQRARAIERKALAALRDELDPR